MAIIVKKRQFDKKERPEEWKGKKMPGRHGSKKVTVKNLKIVKIFEDKNVVLISGAIPGRRNSLITVREK